MAFPYSSRTINLIRQWLILDLQPASRQHRPFLLLIHRPPQRNFYSGSDKYASGKHDSNCTDDLRRYFWRGGGKHRSEYRRRRGGTGGAAGTYAVTDECEHERSVIDTRES